MNSRERYRYTRRFRVRLEYGPEPVQVFDEYLTVPSTQTAYRVVEAALRPLAESQQLAEGLQTVRPTWRFEDSTVKDGQAYSTWSANTPLSDHRVWIYEVSHANC